ncbi:MAG: radical SAM protein [Candidatus Aminicenantes bacterium]|nr:radical SAM protein [Candidatus Aminicenantes bacterium]NIM85140.1 radical SAM protein [Candidatus Aminicenantes bacterium]NIN24650.1 radical SAM protein [Candidatus Aminicenantes bacterium]NIN48411.1 radical SAM protein [Candidatus Aminicenantes bacterium]NIN91314.1 radical SAM protein [Candidatus Aminicenantes bacterium]
MSESKHKRLVLVKPPEHYYWNFGAFSLGVLAAGVRHLADVSILDTTNMNMEEAVDAVWSQEPDIVGITLMGVPSVNNGTAFIKALKEKRPSASPIIVGGHGASMLPEPLLKAGADCAVFGEGELTLQHILEKGISPGMPGTTVLVNDRVVRGVPRDLISPLELLNEPARDLMSPPTDGIHLMEASRGCPHNCEFCETTRFYGTRWRPHTPERVVQEVKRLMDDYDAYLIHFADDNFTASTKRVKQICQQLIEEDTVPAYFIYFARADDLIKDPELLPLMAEARMLRVTVGIDTLDPKVGENVSKTIPVEVYHEAFERMREVGIFAIGSLIVGLPGESPEAREKALERLVEAGPDFAQFLPYLPLPGLPRDPRHTGYDAHPDDAKEAVKLSRAYALHPTVAARLERLVEKGGIQGQLALGALKWVRAEQQAAGGTGVG